MNAGRLSMLIIVAAFLGGAAGCPWPGPGDTSLGSSPTSRAETVNTRWPFPTATLALLAPASPTLALAPTSLAGPTESIPAAPPPPTAIATIQAMPVAESDASPASTPLMGSSSAPAVTYSLSPGSVLPSPGYQSPDLVVDQELEWRIRDYLGSDVDAYGIIVKRLTDGRGVAINPDTVFYAASLFKLEVLYAVFKQKALGVLDFDEALTVTPFHATYDLNTLPWAVGTQVTVAELLEAMITISDNTSAIVLNDRVGWLTVDDDSREAGLLNSSVLDEALPTTAYDMFTLMDLIASGEAVDRQSSEEMIGLLSRQRINNRLPAMLPPETLVAHKTGEWENATHDVGIVYAPKGTYVIALLSSKPWDISTLAELSALVYEYFDSLP